MVNDISTGIAENVLSADNPSGSITNLDLELASEVLTVGVILAKAPDIKHKILGTQCDNSPAVDGLTAWLQD